MLYKVFYITYENSNHNQRSDGFGSEDIQEIKSKLKAEGFFQTSKGWEKKPVGWNGPMRAYIQALDVKRKEGS